MPYADESIRVRRLACDPPASDTSLLRLSRHARERARQRGLRESDLDTVIRFGTPVHDGYILTRRDVDEIERVMRDEIGRLRRLSCVFVSVAGDTVTSVYRPARPKRRRLLEEAS